MTTRSRIKAAIAIAGVLSLGACGTMDNAGNASSSGTSSQENAYSGYGVVQSIEQVKQENTGIGGSGVGVGTIAGGVVGGVVGSQIGSGKGQAIATILGVVGGAYAGHALESRYKQQADVYRFTVRMDNGSYQTLLLKTNADFRVGDRVQIENGVMRRY